MIYCLLSLPVKSSLSFAIFTTGSRNIRTVKKTIISGARSSACQKFHDVSFYITVFSVAYGFLLHYILGLNFICWWSAFNCWKTSAKTTQSLLRTRLGENHLKMAEVFLFRRSVTIAFLPEFTQGL